MLEPTTRPSLDLEVSFNTVAVKDAAILAIASSLRVLRLSYYYNISEDKQDNLQNPAPDEAGSKSPNGTRGT